MNRDELLAAIEASATFEFARSGGPGGQNVNKVNTKASCRVPVGEIGLPPADLELVLSRLSGRLLEGGILLVSASDTRSQILNRGLALARAADLVAQALHREKPRRATKPTRASRERRLESKKHDAGKKTERRPSYDD
ncbi:MAG: alternative ribosome rescue aminoacyl-tRNA hydrolase ArfB [Rectinemataceae bacterium]